MVIRLTFPTELVKTVETIKSEDGSKSEGKKLKKSQKQQALDTLNDLKDILPTIKPQDFEQKPKKLTESARRDLL